MTRSQEVARPVTLHDTTAPAIADLYFEDFAIGRDLPGAQLTLSGDEATWFGDQFGPGAPEPGTAGSDADPVSGFHVAALGMRLLFAAFLHRTASLGAPGVDAVSWPHPVRPGDRLRFDAKVTAARLSVSRPEMGLVTVAITIFNQAEACVMTQENAIMVARRPLAIQRDAVARDATETGA